MSKDLKNVEVILKKSNLPYIEGGYNCGTYDEFKPNVRGECYTAKFKLTHPESIENDLKSLKEKFNNQLNESLVKNNFK